MSCRKWSAAFCLPGCTLRWLAGELRPSPSQTQSKPTAHRCAGTSSSCRQLPPLASRATLSELPHSDMSPHACGDVLSIEGLGHTLERCDRVNLHRSWMCFGLDGVALWRQFRAVPAD